MSAQKNKTLALNISIPTSYPHGKILDDHIQDYLAHCQSHFGLDRLVGKECKFGGSGRGLQKQFGISFISLFHYGLLR